MKFVRFGRLGIDFFWEYSLRTMFVIKFGDFTKLKQKQQKKKKKKWALCERGFLSKCPLGWYNLPTRSSKNPL